MLVDGSHAEYFGESKLCIGVLFHIEGGLKCLYQDRAKITIFSILGTTHKDEFE